MKTTQDQKHLTKTGKKISFLIVIMLALFQAAISQNVGINSTGAAPAASAMLDISSGNSGLLIPRVALTATNAAGPVTSPATSLLVYNTATAGSSPNNVTPGYYYWSGSAWLPLGNSWTTSGNAGTTAGTHFVGTTDAIDFVVKTNSIEKARVTSSGNVGIGTSTFDGTNPEKVLVNSGVTASVNSIVGKGSINSYLQLNIQNQSAGTGASSDVVATADNGNETSNYVDMGINSSGNTSTVMGAANDAYLYNLGQNFLIGTGTAAKSLVFMTGGTAQSTNERMRIDGSGNVGIGNNSPNSTLSISGSLAMKYRSGTGNYTLLTTDYVIINTGAAANWTMPAASGCSGRIYRLVNQGTGSITLSLNVTTASGISTPTLLVATNFEVISDGTVWRKIN